MRARLDRPGLLFAAIGLAGLALPLVQFKPNRIVLGEGLSLTAALPQGLRIDRKGQDARQPAEKRPTD